MASPTPTKNEGGQGNPGPLSMKDGTILKTLDDAEAWLVEQTPIFQALRQEPGTRVDAVRLGAEMARVQKWRTGWEEWVYVDVPASATGEWFKINEVEYPPGRHRVRASVARDLLSRIDANRQAEMALYRRNGRTVDLGAIGDKAKMDAIQRD